MHFYDNSMILWFFPSSPKSDSRVEFLTERTFNRRPAQNLLRSHIAWKATFSVHHLQRNMEFTSACFFKSWILSHPSRSWWFVTSVVFSRKKKWSGEKSIMAQSKALHCSATSGTLNYHLAHITISRMLKYPAMRHMNFLQTVWVLLQNERAKLASLWAFWDLRYIDNKKDHCMVTEMKHLSTQRSLYSRVQQFHLGSGAPGHVVAV